MADAAHADCTHRMYWFMLDACNFSCAYCFRRFGDKQAAEAGSRFARVDCGDVARRFDDTGFGWRVYMTGGEPLLYPGFLDLAAALTQRHIISFSTSLALPVADRLADTMDPRRVALIDVSLHILEREKDAAGLDSLVRRFTHLRSAGFNLRLSYVAYPPLLARMESDFCRLAKQGISVEPRVFQGKHEGRRYPRDYSPADRDLLLRLGLNPLGCAVLDKRNCWLGRKCQAGWRTFIMDPLGQVTRCHSLDQSYGNLFDGTFRPADCRAIRRCTARKCVCAYEGMTYAAGPPRRAPRRLPARAAQAALWLNDRWMKW